MSACPYAWCTNTGTGHLDHWNNGETTAALDGPGSAQISCYAMVDREVYPDEIMLAVRSVGDVRGTAITVGEGIGLSLTVGEAQQLHRLLEVAMACRAEIRGSDG